MMLETFRQAVQNVWSNKLRSFLTMLGIIIGVMAVIVIVGLGNGMTGMFTDLYNTMGSDLLAINLYTSGTRTVSVDEMHRLIEAKPEYFRSLSPIYGASTQMKVGSKEYRFTSVSGVNEDYLTIEKYDLASGRGLQYADILDTKSICVIGDYVNRVIFGGNGLGQTLKVGPNPYRVVGVLQPKTKNLAQQQEGGQDDMVFVPYSTLMRQEHQNVVNMYYAILAEGAETTPAKAYLQTELEKRVSRDDYIYVESLSESIQMMSGMINIMVGILTAIAGISLLGGRYPLCPGRKPGHRSWLSGLPGHQPDPAPVYRQPGGGDERLPLLRCSRGGLYDLGGHRRAVWLSARQTRCTAQSH